MCVAIYNKVCGLYYIGICDLYNIGVRDIINGDPATPPVLYATIISNVFPSSGMPPSRV